MRTLTQLVYLLSLSLLSHVATAQVIHTSGRHILGPCNDTLILKGVSNAPYNWGWNLNHLKVDEIAQTGANVVRLVWYISTSNGPNYSNYVALDSAISKCVQKKMVVILSLLDFTCKNNPSNLITGANWFISPNVLPILLKYKESIIVNLNEALYVDWDPNPTSALVTYKNTYQTIITNLRAASGFNFPILIDAPDCGGNIDKFVLNNTATSLITHDPIHNLIFSVHAYWYVYANNDSSIMNTKITNAQSQTFPLLFTEIANKQDDATYCQYTLNYSALLKILKDKQIGWLAWSWDYDQCASRQMSTNGNFNSLTTYGNDIVNNPIYGLQTNTIKSLFLENGNCSPPLNIISNKVEARCDNQKVKIKYHSDLPYKLVVLKSQKGLHWETQKEIRISKSDDEIEVENETNKYTLIKLVDKKNGQASSGIISCGNTAELTTIYPNPANDFIVVNTVFANPKIVIKNSVGELMISQQYYSNENKIETSKWNSGVYFIETYHQNLFVECKKIVVSK